MLAAEASGRIPRALTIQDQNGAQKNYDSAWEDTGSKKTGKNSTWSNDGAGDGKDNWDSSWKKSAGAGGKDSWKAGGGGKDDFWGQKDDAYSGGRSSGGGGKYDSWTPKEKSWTQESGSWGGRGAKDTDHGGNWGGKSSAIDRWQASDEGRGGSSRGQASGGSRAGWSGAGQKRGRYEEDAPSERPSKQIKVKNIPHDLDRRDIKGAFEADAGKISRCELEKGTAWITFNRPEDARKAVEIFDRGELNGKTIEVSMER